MTRQRHTRVRRRLKVAVSCKGRQLEAVSGNLSQSGMLIHCADVLQPGVAVSGALQLEDQSLAFSALVRWSRASNRPIGPPVYSMGLEFLATPGKPYYTFVKLASKQPDPPPEATNMEEFLEAPRMAAGIATQAVSSPPPRPAAVTAAPISNGVHHHQGRVTQPPTHASLSPPAVSPSATTQPAPHGIVVGQSGRAEGSTRASGQRTSGTLPLAPSSAAPLFERAAVAALPPAIQTLGVSLQVFLTAPPYVTIGGKLEAVATLIDVSPKKLRFRVEMREGERLVATGEHERLVQ